VPRDRHALGVDSGLELVHEHRPEVAALDVFLAGPDGLDGNAFSFRDLDRVGHEVRRDVGAAAETASEECRVDVDLFRRQTGDGGADFLIHRLVLRPGPDVAPIRLHVRDRVQRLHEQGEVRELVDRSTVFAALASPSRRRPRSPRRGRLVRELPILLAHFLRVQAPFGPSSGESESLRPVSRSEVLAITGAREMGFT
jgi:hypothetical protein